ncbi:MAG: alpha-mannosidase [Armatimonadetes bacterium]|nr:alpha-mannosidase [Armatimonadota bacterium]
MLKHAELTEKRIEQFIRLFLEPRLFGEAVPLRVEFCGEPHANQGKASRAEFTPVEPGFRWGPVWRTVWFRATGTVPRPWAGKEVVARLEVGGERTVWKANSPIWGLDRVHPHYRISSSARGGERVDLLVQAYGHHPAVRVHGRMGEPEPEPFEVGEVAIRTFDKELWQFYLDCRFAADLLKSLPEGDVAREHLLRGLNETVNLFDPERKESLIAARRTLREATAPRRVDRYHFLTPVGHAHLDTAWLWPLQITMKKMAHTAATQLALMDEYPEYTFVHSQPAQYEWLETQYPKLFERVKDKIAEGQWEPLGSMWVEADMNLPGGESLVRQFLYGKRYFASRFNIETVDLWLPDVFGYSAALPQILSKCGIEYFLTQKISWNQFNRFPHNTFWWQGIDGTRVWTHFPPADTYCGNCLPSQIRKHISEHRDHARCDYGLYVFGHGDGGGGPAAEQIEFLRRAARAPAMPQLEWRKAREFFEEAKEKSRDLPEWVGELYFELHRGTYTTQAKTKKWNRVLEFLLRDLELLCCFEPDFPSAYPAADLESLWKTVLLNQFHDIIPGTSVRAVYEEAEREYQETAAHAESLLRQSLERISAGMDTTGTQRPAALFQFADVVSEGRVSAPKGKTPQSLVCCGESVPVQLIEEFGDPALIFPVPEAALGAVAVGDFRSDAPATRPRLKASPRKLENDTWAVRFDAHGNITSVVSLEDQTEHIEPGKLANLFQLFDDRPVAWSAWDIDLFAFETQKDLTRSERFEIVERGPVRVAAEVERRFGNSRIIQRVSLGPTPGIRFDTVIDWHEDEKMLKVAFPVNVNTARVTCEIQFGNLERPTHANTSWDMAKYEICAHKWIDLSEGDQGAALLNDCKYGHDVRGNVMRLTLLRSPKAPDPEADMGRHRFTYVLLPHFGAYNWAGVVQAAYALNAPLRCCFIGKGPGEAENGRRLVVCEDRNIVVEAVKKAEDSDNMIVRLYEAHNSRGRAELVCAKQVKAAYLCDLMEKELGELDMVDGTVQFDYRPFEIITIKLVV